MIGLDTNVLVRYITQDNKKQATLANKWVEKNCKVNAPGWISSIVLCETCWVLSRAYGYNKKTIQLVIQRILSASELAVEHQEEAWAALSDYTQGNADFSDYLIAHTNQSYGCKYSITFDKKAANHRMMQFLE